MARTIRWVCTGETPDACATGGGGDPALEARVDDLETAVGALEGDVADLLADMAVVETTLAGFAAVATSGSASDLTTGTLPAARIADGSLDKAKIANIATDRLLGRDTASSGAVEELTVGGGLEFTGSGGIQRSALSGDISASAGSGVTAIGANKVVTSHILDANVTLAKIANIAQDRLLGRVSSGSGVPEELTIAQVKAMLGLDQLKCWMWFGVATVSAGGSAVYLGFSGSVITPATSSIHNAPLPHSGTITKVYYNVATAHTTNTVEVRPRLSGVDTDINMDIAAGTTKELFTVASPPSVTQGNLLGCMVNHNGATNLARCIIGFEITYSL